MNRAPIRAYCLVVALATASLACLRAPHPLPTAAPATQAAPVTVFAAASLTDAFREMGAIFEANTSAPVTFNFAASTQLRTQLEQGAQADVFASADQRQMDRARQAALIAGPDITFVTNRLVLISPRANPGRIQEPADLARPGLKLVTTQPDVPIGVYTQVMLEAMSQEPQYGTDFRDRVNANVVSLEPNVRQVVAKILLGEGDAGVVYRSDVTPQAALDLTMLEVPDAYNTIAAYPIAVVSGAPQAELGGAFMALVLSPEGQGVLSKWNFTPVAAVGAYDEPGASLAP